SATKPVESQQVKQAADATVSAKIDQPIVADDDAQIVAPNEHSKLAAEAPDQTDTQSSQPVATEAARQPDARRPVTIDQLNTLLPRGEPSPRHAYAGPPADAPSAALTQPTQSFEAAQAQASIALDVPGKPARFETIFAQSPRDRAAAHAPLNFAFSPLNAQ